MAINCLQGILNGSRRRVKIMKADGTVMKLWSPVHVKEILGYYTDHQIFEADRTRRLNICSRPLSHSAELRPGRLYFLIPVSSPMPSESIGMYLKSFSDRNLATEESDDIKSRIFSSADKGSTVRLRIRLSKEEASSLLSVGGNKAMEDIMAPLIQQAISNRQQKTWHSLSRRWKPSLETIFEPLSPILDNSTY